MKKIGRQYQVSENRTDFYVYVQEERERQGSAVCQLQTEKRPHSAEGRVRKSSTATAAESGCTGNDVTLSSGSQRTTATLASLFERVHTHAQ